LGRVGAGRRETVTTAARIIKLPPLPELPELLRGRALAVIPRAF
jgi:hypothetical protein